MCVLDNRLNACVRARECECFCKCIRIRHLRVCICAWVSVYGFVYLCVEHDISRCNAISNAIEYKTHAMFCAQNVCVRVRVITRTCSVHCING